MALAKPGDPLVGMGTMLTPDTEDDAPPDQPSVAIPNLRKLVVKSRLSLQDLPADTKTQSVVNAVLVYHLLGMTDNEIALALGVGIIDVQQVKALPAYQETFELLFGEIISANSNSLQARIAQYAGDAVENVMNLAKQKDFEKVPPIVILKANQDILDRSGLNHETLFGKNADKGEENTLRVVVTSGNENKVDVNVNFKRK